MSTPPTIQQVIDMAPAMIYDPALDTVDTVKTGDPHRTGIVTTFLASTR